jgi:hypothetical protein
MVGRQPVAIIVIIIIYLTANGLSPVAVVIMHVGRRAGYAH